MTEILELRHADLTNEDVQDMHGVRLTRPLRTIADLVKGIGPPLASALYASTLVSQRTLQEPTEAYRGTPAADGKSVLSHIGFCSAF
jgi:hypothetical protein